ncbi:putative homeodomain transcription factor 1 isoform X2 [Danio rerio]|uniref:Homeodomain transcription factor 1 n=1 Tax=Danio rerio TaxID=7955 RepID=A9ULS8_DANRE|nr:putative homeodomain transcription factor 1 [Danio rerio]XP_009304233.1 putative homeodomain transcription factor 1 isoform X1 [Danio rerio]AAI57384.1 Zgc:175264 protein [Danio rerio]|eukprot:NP_001107901.1 putative homeodomain transcription factor 1 [Danio rerio]
MAGIAWYQKKIGAYDQQIWEKSLEQTEFKGFGNKLKKTGHIKPDLIDVDLVRGSTFSKAKPESPWTALTRKGLVRVLFFPFFFQWWIQVTSKCISTLILVLYVLQVAGAVLYFEVPAACASEVVGPLCLMLLLGTVHCQIVSTESSRSPDISPVHSRTASPIRRKRQRKSRKAKRSGDEGSRVAGIVELKPWQLEDNHRLYRSEKTLNSLRRPPYGASEDLSSEEEEEEAEEAELQKERLFSSAPPKYASALRNRLHNVPKNNVQPQAQGESNGMPTEIPGLPREVEHLRPSEGSHPASDTDDMLWEELLQDSDSASTGSSEIGEDEPHSQSHSLPVPTIALTSDEDEDENEALPQHQFSWLQACHPSKDRVSAIIWEQGECKKADMSVLEISGIILTRVKVVEQGMGYLIFGGLVTASLALLPYCFRLAQKLDLSAISLEDLPAVAIGSPCAFSYAFFIIATMERVFLCGLFFFMMCVAERTYRQRLLFAKLFSHLTSARKAKKSEIPHFRLKKVQNIKMWLSLRSFLKRRGPQRSVDVIVSSIFLLALSIAFIICAQLLHSHHTFLDSETNWELVVWCAALMVFLLRLATLGAETNRKYSNASVLLTEQINLYLKMEKKPNKKDQLNIVNNVLRLATKLLKELDTPFRLLGLTVNPLIYNITRVLILSAVSAAVSDLLGFNIRLWKIKP